MVIDMEFRRIVDHQNHAQDDNASCAIQIQTCDMTVSPDTLIWYALGIQHRNNHKSLPSVPRQFSQSSILSR
jgi:hypothetical protein